MASAILKASTFLSMAVFSTFLIVNGSDPDIRFDYTLPPNVTINDINGSFFSFTGMRGLINQNPPTFTVTKASLASFPAKIGQSVSLALLQFPAGSVNAPHTHPRAAELHSVVNGSLEVGFVDATNKLLTQTRRQSDSFLFPEGLVHFQFNNGNDSSPVTAVSAFGSADAGTVMIPLTLFGSAIDEEVLAAAFKTNVCTVEKSKPGLVHRREGRVNDVLPDQ